MFFGGEEVGHGLAGVRIVGKAVDDGDGGVGGEFLEFAVFEDACHDAVDHAGEDTGDIGDGLAGSQANLVGRDVQRAAAEVVHRDFEGDAGAQRGFFEDAGKGLAFGDLVAAARLLELLLEPPGDIQNVAQKLLRRIGKGNKIHFGGHRITTLQNHVSSQPSSISVPTPWSE